MNPLELPEIIAHVFDQLPLRDVFACLLVCREWYAEANRPLRWPATKITPTGYIYMQAPSCSPLGHYFGGSEVIYKIENPATIHKWISCNLDKNVLFALVGTDLSEPRTHIFAPRNRVKDRISRHIIRADPRATRIYISNLTRDLHDKSCNINEMTNAEVLGAIECVGTLRYTVEPTWLQRFIEDL